MARVVRLADATDLGLPGRTSLEIVSGATGAGRVTLRLVEIPVAQPGEAPREPHLHRDFEECIHVLSGHGATHSDSGVHPLAPGDTILIPAGERHVTRNTGDAPMMLLCFFPHNDIGPGTEGATFGEPGR